MTKSLNLTRRQFLESAAAVGLIASSVGVAMGSVVAQEMPTKGGVLRVARKADPSSLDPHFGTAGMDNIILHPIYDTLISYDLATLEPQPGLAESWDSTNPTTLRLNLRKNILFHDGEPFNGEAVRYNIERLKNHPRSTSRAELTNVERVEVVDEHTVDIIFSRPDTAVLMMLADRAGMMVSPKAAEASPDGIDRAPVGTGAYKLVEWLPGNKVILTAHADGWNRNSHHLDGIEFTIIADSEAQANALVSGQVDLIDEVQMHQVDRLKATPGLVTHVDPSIQYQKISTNRTRGALANKDIRRAINHAIDREALNRALQNGAGEAAWLPYPSSHWSYQTDMVPTFPYDPAKARELIAASGIEGPIAINAVIFAGADASRRAELVQAMLSAVGIDLKITSLELVNAVRAFREEQQFDAMISEWTGRVEPNQTVAIQFHPQGMLNPGGHSVEAVNQGLVDTAAVFEIEERKKRLRTLYKAITEEAIELPLFFMPAAVAHQDTVQGFRPNLVGKTRFDGLWLKPSA